MFTFMLSTGSTSLTNSASEDQATGLRLAALLRAARSVISNHQELINDPSPGDKQLTGERVVEEAVALFEEREGHRPLSETLNDRERKLINAEIDSIREILNENQSLINAEGIAFKGFIPAVFARLVNERFAEKVGSEALLKVTAPNDLVRNRKARPDSWEQFVFADHLQRADWRHGDSFVEEAEHSGRGAFRMLIPEYYSVSCLSCHGEPKGELDVTGYPKEGGEEGDLAGAISITLFR
ncbi:Tll0287-like domain-containing protein [Aurantimonas sp. A2-1-M11]|uniref:Tll0287-like domain-containing protein n=1 Tax=Aurantimonas sp. A2-1-M11 TaxID=3113712 RepID=UPI003FA5E1A7